MAIATYVSESILYRTSGDMVNALAVDGLTDEQKVQLMEEYAVECSINKIYSSEALDMVADETVQIFGGYGYSEEYPADQIYRDARINRIFEGTNEINRLVITNTILRRSMKGELPEIPLTLDFTAGSGSAAEGLFVAEQKALAAVKQAFLITAAMATQKFGKTLGNQQEILGILADLVTEIYAMESSLLRTIKVFNMDGADLSALKTDMVKCYFSQTMPKVTDLCRQAFAAMVDNDALGAKLNALENMLHFTPVDVIAARRRIAASVIVANGYSV